MAQASNRLIKEWQFLAGGARGGQRPSRTGRIMPAILVNRVFY